MHIAHHLPTTRHPTLILLTSPCVCVSAHCVAYDPLCTSLTTCPPVCVCPTVSLTIRRAHRSLPVHHQSSTALSLSNSFAYHQSVHIAHHQSDTVVVCESNHIVACVPHALSTTGPRTSPTTCHNVDTVTVPDPATVCVRAPQCRLRSVVHIAHYLPTASLAPSLSLSNSVAYHQSVHIAHPQSDTACCRV